MYSLARQQSFHASFFFATTAPKGAAREERCMPLWTVPKWSVRPECDEREEPQCQTENDLYRIKQLKTITGARQLHFSRLSPILSSAEEGEVNARRPQSISDERLSKSIYQLFFFFAVDWHIRLAFDRDGIWLIDKCVIDDTLSRRDFFETPAHRWLKRARARRLIELIRIRLSRPATMINNFTRHGVTTAHKSWRKHVKFA